MNTKLAIFAITLVAIVMISGSIMPSMAAKDDNNGNAKGCEKANDNSKVREKNPHCETDIDLCGLFAESSVRDIKQWISANAILGENGAGIMTLSEWTAVGGSVELFDEVSTNGTFITAGMIKNWVSANCV